MSAVYSWQCIGVSLHWALQPSSASGSRGLHENPRRSQPSGRSTVSTVGWASGGDSGVPSAQLAMAVRISIPPRYVGRRRHALNVGRSDRDGDGRAPRRGRAPTSPRPPLLNPDFPRLRPPDFIPRPRPPVRRDERTTRCLGQRVPANAPVKLVDAASKGFQAHGCLITSAITAATIALATPPLTRDQTAVVRPIW